MPGYVTKALNQFRHETPSRKQDSPYQWNQPKYGEEVQNGNGDNMFEHVIQDGFYRLNLLRDLV